MSPSGRHMLKILQRCVLSENHATKHALYISSNALGNVVTCYTPEIVQFIQKPFSTMKYFVIALEKY